MNIFDKVNAPIPNIFIIYHEIHNSCLGKNQLYGHFIIIQRQ